MAVKVVMKQPTVPKVLKKNWDVGLQIKLFLLMKFIAVNQQSIKENVLKKIRETKQVVVQK